jgi:hypothetical protein
MKMRSPLWFAAAAVVGIAGLVGAYLYVVPRIEAIGANLHQVVMPGPVTVTLDKAGPYTIFAEIGGVIGGRLYDSPPPRGVRITLTSEATGNPLVLAAPHASVDYSIGPRRGHAVLGFMIDQPGRYRIASTGAPDGEYVLAIARGSAMGSMGEMFGTIAVTIAIFVGSLGVAALIVVATVMQRDKARKAALK